MTEQPFVITDIIDGLVCAYKVLAADRESAIKHYVEYRINPKSQSAKVSRLDFKEHCQLVSDGKLFERTICLI